MTRYDYFLIFFLLGDACKYNRMGLCSKHSIFSFEIWFFTMFIFYSFNPIHLFLLFSYLAHWLALNVKKMPYLKVVIIIYIENGSLFECIFATRFKYFVFWWIQLVRWHFHSVSHVTTYFFFYLITKIPMAFCSLFVSCDFYSIIYTEIYTEKWILYNTHIEIWLVGRGLYTSVSNLKTHSESNLKSDSVNWFGTFMWRLCTKC